MIGMRKRNVQLLGVFAIFTLLIFGFAIWYYYIWLNDPSTFAFNADIIATQERAWATRIGTAEAKLRLAPRELLPLIVAFSRGRRPNVVNRMERGSLAKRGIMTAFPYTYEFEMSNDCVSVSPCSAVLHVTNERGEALNSWQVPAVYDQAEPDWDYILWQVRLRVIDDYIANPGMFSVSEAWGYWDFVYFSAITATTVGYGDILPNSTRVRVVVLLQVLISSFLLVVVVNLALALRRRSPPRPSRLSNAARRLRWKKRGIPVATAL